MTSESVNELLPCPFCGCANVMFEKGGPTIDATCQECGACVPGTSPVVAEMAWNRRTDAALAERIAQLEREKLDSLSERTQMKQERDTAQSELSSAKDEIHKWARKNAETVCERDRFESELAAAHAKIDSLMLEYCPDEMSKEQFQNWAAHQRRVGPEEEAAINAAIAARTQDAGKGKAE